ncbi:hypothetical protein [Flagellimonas flava]|uniref:hypothetical protein n=1 Tax=Flagellimonas flava TaxID=570519 RepID=UPI003D660219
MKIEKYNQRLLAILGTVGVIFLIIALIAFVSMWALELGRYSDDDINTGILSQEKIEQLQQENKREQVISYETPRLIDTLNSVYIIPVSHKTLGEPEDIDESLNALSSEVMLEKVDLRYTNYFYGAFNNLIIYKPALNEFKKLFNKRVNFNEIQTEYFEDDVLLFLSVSEKDTFKDGVINLKDYKTLYIYSMGSGELKKVAIEGTDVFHFKVLNTGKDIAIRFGIDKNKDGKYEERNEPTIIKKYDFETGKLVDIVDEKVDAELQRTLEGTK